VLAKKRFCLFKGRQFFIGNEELKIAFEIIGQDENFISSWIGGAAEHCREARRFDSGARANDIGIDLKLGHISLKLAREHLAI
jgi:hypothetical protein